MTRELSVWMGQYGRWLSICIESFKYKVFVYPVGV